MSVPRIEQLSEAVANQIAAGEVVERPASVVKELVENAMDADARRITVEVAEGGTTRLRVVDDGHGMIRADAERALLRHATSKIRKADDLWSVRSFGFRGEALPSIASVSRLTLTTRARGTPEGTRVHTEGGRAPVVETIGAPEGTSVTADDLFFNVPARKKFLKRAQTELSHVTETVTRLALARPDISFRLSTEHKTIIAAPAETEGDPRGRLGRILGKGTADRLHVIETTGPDEPVRVSGFVAEPGLTERGAKGLYVFVNHRFVRDRTIQHAIQDAYRTLLERGRYPVVILFLELDPEAFDVNVHPQKTEVRFARTQEVHRAVTRAVGRTLEAQPWMKRASKPAVARTYRLDGGQRSYAEPPSPAAFERGRAGDNYVRALGNIFTPRPDPGPQEGPGFVPAAPDAGVPSTRLEAAPPEARPVPAEGTFAGLAPVGQVLGTYLVCQGSDRLVMIDQHAAHERITFQRLREQKRSDTLAIQPLLVPEVVELSPGRDALAREFVAQIAELGLEIEPFGELTWQIKSAPAVLEGANVAAMLVDLLDELAEVGAATAIEERLDALCSRAACHTAVRAQDRLTNSEIAALLADMDTIDFGAFCPHGRPVYVEWSRVELEKLFHRR